MYLCFRKRGLPGRLLQRKRGNASDCDVGGLELKHVFSPLPQKADPRMKQQTRTHRQQWKLSEAFAISSFAKGLVEVSWTR